MNKLFAICIVLFTLPALAITVEKPLPSATDEAMAQRLFASLRCVVCEGQPLSESDAPLAIDMRQTIRQMIRAGNSEHDVLSHFTTRYGDAILLTPPVNQHTSLLWLMPLALLSIGGLIVWRQFRKQGA